jgi:Protein of unknown function (DUF815)
LSIVAHWLKHFGVTDAEEARGDALRFALERGSRSGRVAWQFAKDYAGRLQAGPKRVAARATTQASTRAQARATTPKLSKAKTK